MSTSPNRIAAIDAEELVAAIRRETSGTEGWVHATGQLEQVEVKLAGQGADRRRTIPGRVTLANLTGPIGGPYGVTLARETHAGVELHAGTLLAARALGVMLLIAPAELPANLRSNQDVAVSDEEHEQFEPEVGDLIHHFAFGRCEVLMVTGDRLKIRDLTEPGRVREISIERLKVTGPTDEAGKRLFNLVRKV